MTQLQLIEVPPQPPEWDAMDVFYSRPEYVRPLVQYLDEVARTVRAVTACIAPHRPIVEPCVGAGAIVDGLHSCWQYVEGHVLTGDARDVGADWCGDWTQPAETWTFNRDVEARLKRAGTVISNPPFRSALPIIEASWRHCPDALVAMLLPWRWYENTEERGDWLRMHNPDLVQIGRCEFFRPDGSSAGKGDSTTYAWAIWGPDKQGPLGGHHELRPWKESP